jgi:hypothetical protein
MKVCIRCRIKKSLVEFYALKTASDGHCSDCKTCRNVSSVTWQKRSPKKTAAIRKRTYAKHRAKIIAGVIQWGKDHPIRHAASIARWHATHPESKKKAAKQWRSTHAAEINNFTAQRRAKKTCATPAWANGFFIAEAYRLATLRTKLLGFNWHVDHIVPLRSKLVCGLHVENNLQVIPSKTNMQKGNRYWPDMPETSHG